MDVEMVHRGRTQVRHSAISGATAPFIEQFFVGINNSNIIVRHMGLLQQAMRQMNSVDTAANDPHFKHEIVFSFVLLKLPRANPSI